MPNQSKPFHTIGSHESLYLRINQARDLYTKNASTHAEVETRSTNSTPPSFDVIWDKSLLKAWMGNGIFRQHVRNVDCVDDKLRTISLNFMKKEHFQAQAQWLMLELDS